MKDKPIQQHTIHLGILVAVCLTLLSAIVFVLYRIQDLESLAQAKALEVETKQAEQTEDYTYRGLIKNTEADRKRAEQYFVSKDQLVTYIEALEQLATSTNVFLETTISPQTISKFDLKISGTYANTYRFLYLLERMPYYSSIQILNLTRRSDFMPGTRAYIWDSAVSLTLLGYIE
jgi:hypothetical protein